MPRPDHDNPQENLASDQAKASAPSPTGHSKRENPLVNLGFNILIPVVLLSKGSDWFGISAALNLCLALAFPVGYGLYDFLKRRKANLFSVIGFVSILLTGGFALLELPKGWMVLKETAVPLLFGLIVAATQFSRRPLVEKLLMNRDMFEVDKIKQRLSERGSEEPFRAVLRACGWLVVGSFMLSAALNFILAVIILQSPPGTEAYNAELGRLQGISFLVITAPVMAVFIWAFMKFIKGLRTHTGYDIEDVLAAELAAKQQKN